MLDNPCGLINVREQETKSKRMSLAQTIERVKAVEDLPRIERIVKENGLYTSYESISPALKDLLRYEYIIDEPYDGCFVITKRWY